ncbi:MAG: FecR domain-containing protein, partial [Cyanobacteria bacterium]|nr:FecR domain-containing protein [Cyanobacteriota bacterium]MDW8202390.1 FecR domain-containing protein [Cyanobacteriota bacterium SKYGB_h_bin112]
MKKTTIAWLASASFFVLTFVHTDQIGAQQSVRVRVNRWLEVRQVFGNVTYLKGGSSRRAKVGDRLQVVGDGLRTEPNASVRLAIDTEVGFVTIQEKTTVRIQGLQVAPDNGRITRLHVSGGQVQVQVRPFTHRGSRLEVTTPSSVSGVRGTQFGITVQPNGRTGLATLEGSVT